MRIGRRRTKPPTAWYRAALARLAWLAFRPAGPRINWLLFYGAATIGVVVALVTRGRSPLIPVVAVLLVMAAAIVVSAGYRWTWPWQRAYVRESRRSEALITAIVGPRLDPALAEAWLVRSPHAPISDRISILRWLARDDEAELLIPALPTVTPLDRYRKASTEVLQRWRTSGHLDDRSILERIADLDPVERDRAEATIAFWRGVAEVGAGQDLRDVPPPGGGRLSPADEARVWLQRLWSLQWLTVSFLITSVGLGVLSLVLAR